MGAGSGVVAVHFGVSPDDFVDLNFWKKWYALPALPSPEPP